MALLCFLGEVQITSQESHKDENCYINYPGIKDLPRLSPRRSSYTPRGGEIRGDKGMNSPLSSMIRGNAREGGQGVYL